MASTTNASAILADSLAQFSKTACVALTEIENQSRLEVLRAFSEAREAREETREVRAEHDKLARKLHAVTLEAQGWKQTAADAKATLGQAESTIVHQAENIARQAENIETQLGTIAELRREVSQWKDHFLRVEQERYAQSLELLKLQCTRPINATLSTPPSYTSSTPNSNQKRQRDVPPADLSEEVPQTPMQENQNHSSSKRKTKVKDPNVAAAASSLQRRDPTPAASRTTLIRRVQAVVHVKREESEHDSAEDPSVNNGPNYEASDEDEPVGANQRRSSRRNRKIVNDNDDMEQRNPVSDSRHLRHLNAAVNYREEDEDEDDDDELMIGTEDNHAEVYGTQRVQNLDVQFLKQQQPHATAPPKKKRKVAAR